MTHQTAAAGVTGPLTTASTDLLGILLQLDGTAGYQAAQFPSADGEAATGIIRVSDREWQISLRPVPDATQDHNHERLPYGRKVPLGQCPRCDALRDGATARGGWGDRLRRDEEMRQAERRAHFAPGGPHATGQCRPCCTFGDW